MYLRRVIGGPVRSSVAECLSLAGTQVGPRLELELVKVEEGLCEGRVLYHAHVAKTVEEAAELQVQHGKCRLGGKGMEQYFQAAGRAGLHGNQASQGCYRCRPSTRLRLR